MRRNYREIQAQGAAVLAVSFEPRARLFQLGRQFQLPFPLLSDPERDAYRAYRLQRGHLFRLLRPGTVLAYLKLLARGRAYHFQRSDLRQLRGDFVIGREGIVRYEHRGAAPHDRPSVGVLMDALDRI